MARRRCCAPRSFLPGTYGVAVQITGARILRRRGLEPHEARGAPRPPYFEPSPTSTRYRSSNMLPSHRHCPLQSPNSLRVCCLLMIYYGPTCPPPLRALSLGGYIGPVASPIRPHIEPPARTIASCISWSRVSSLSHDACLLIFSSQ